MKKSDLFLEAFENSFANLTEACKEVGVSRTQVMLLAKNDPVFNRKLSEIVEGFNDLAISTQFKLGILGDATCLKHYLDAHAKHRGYGKTEETADKNAYSDVVKPIVEENPEEDFRKQIKNASAQDIRKALSNIRKVKC